MGRTGMFDGGDVLDIMLTQPACGQFIVSKLWHEFVSPTPDAKEVKRIAQRLQQSNYAISGALADLLTTSAFWDTSNRGSLIKSPVDLVVGTVRQFGFSYSEVMPFVLKTAQLGQNLLMPPNVKGWPGHTDWINTTTLLERKNFTQQLFRANDQSVEKMTMLKVGKATASISFDPDGFLRPYDGRSDGVPNDTVKTTLAGVLLASDATQNIANGTVGIAYLRTLTLDPAYQLK
jgi:uncharacterized protein (DUF1800 family)